MLQGRLSPSGPRGELMKSCFQAEKLTRGGGGGDSKRRGELKADYGNPVYLIDFSEVLGGWGG